MSTFNMPGSHTFPILELPTNQNKRSPPLLVTTLRRAANQTLSLQRANQSAARHSVSTNRIASPTLSTLRLPLNPIAEWSPPAESNLLWYAMLLPIPLRVTHLTSVGVYQEPHPANTTLWLSWCYPGYRWNTPDLCWEDKVPTPLPALH